MTFWCILFWVPPVYAESITGRVIHVSDGDSFTIDTGRGRVEIRLFGIDSPEGDQPFGEQARKRMAALILRRTIAVAVRDRDDYGRVVGEAVLSDGRDLGAVMVEEGLAWWFRRYAPERLDLEKLEATARRKRLGLWSASEPVPPWLWRRRPR